MDYNNIFQSTYSSVLKQKQNFAIELLAQFKKEGRAFDFAHSEISNSFYSDLLEIDIKSPYDVKKFQDLLAKSGSYYSIDAVENMLKNDLRELFIQNYNSKSYSSFIPQLATRTALRRAYLGHKWNYEFSEYLFHYKEFEKYTLKVYEKGIFTIQEFGNYERRNEYRLKSPYGHIPDLKDVDNLEEQLKSDINARINSSQKGEKRKKNRTKNSELPLIDLNEDEKLLLIHYLIRSPSLDKIEKVKILALIGNSPISIDIFKQESRDNIQYQQVLKGYQYRGIKKARETLTSLYDQVEVFKIDNLNRAIKMDLNAIKNEKIKKTLNKN